MQHYNIESVNNSTYAERRCIYHSASDSSCLPTWLMIQFLSRFSPGGLNSRKYPVRHELTNIIRDDQAVFFQGKVSGIE